MPKKQFNFTQMAESPIAQDANKTMVEAFEKKTADANSKPSKQEKTPIEEKTEVAKTEQVKNGIIPTEHPSTNSGTNTSTPANVLTGKDALRNEYMQFLAASDFTYSKGINVQLPPDICEKMNNIKEELRKTSAANLKMNLKELVQLFVYEGVDKWYTAVTGKKG